MIDIIELTKHNPSLAGVAELLDRLLNALHRARKTSRALVYYVGFVASEFLDDCARKDQLYISLSNQRVERCQNRVLPIISGEIQPYAGVDKDLEQK